MSHSITAPQSAGKSQAAPAPSPFDVLDAGAHLDGPTVRDLQDRARVRHSDPVNRQLIQLANLLRVVTVLADDLLDAHAPDCVCPFCLSATHDFLDDLSAARYQSRLLGDVFVNFTVGHGSLDLDPETLSPSEALTELARRQATLEQEADEAERAEETRRAAEAAGVSPTAYRVAPGSVRDVVRAGSVAAGS